MSKKINGVVATFSPDNLFASSAPAAITGMVKLTANQGILKRGTVLAKATGATTYSALATGMTASYVLADDVDTSIAPQVGQVYKTGHFIADALKVASGYTLAAADKENLRSVGILVSDGIGY